MKLEANKQAKIFSDSSDNFNSKANKNMWKFFDETYNVSEEIRVSNLDPQIMALEIKY